MNCIEWIPIQDGLGRDSLSKGRGNWRNLYFKGGHDG